ncbi:hypothetical protein [Corynebacterium frankenforstense]|uniref:hypothetical protein n=1 Tax=Corynebacterium frankenforstense TaxID=1230998 RepID=UPI0026F1E750|nr:hypothetical protein [Corynebacterium frankenforstense]
MIKEFYAPYLLPDSEDVHFGDWMLADREDPTPLPAAMPDWVAGTDIAVERTISVDLNAVREDCGLSDDVVLNLSLTWIGRSSKIRRTLLTTEARDGEMTVSCTLPGEELGGIVDIATRLVVVDPGASPQPGVADMPGATLIKDVVSIALESDGSMFPVAVVNFVATTYPDQASWHLKTSTDLDANFGATYQVLINEADKKLVKAIESSNPTREEQVILDEMYSGVIEVVLEIALALRERGELEDGGYGEDTVGAVLTGLLRKLGDPDYLDFTDPRNFGLKRSRLQAAARSLSVGRIF